MRQTTEQRSAMQQFRRVVDETAYRVVTDTEGWPLIPGRLGRVEFHDGSTLAVFTDRKRMIDRLAGMPGVRRHQTGDDEARLLFEPTILAAVASAIKARRRRRLTPEQAQKLGSKTAYRTTSPTQDCAGRASA